MVNNIHVPLLSNIQRASSSLWCGDFFGLAPCVFNSLVHLYVLLFKVQLFAEFFMSVLRILFKPILFSQQN